MAGVWICAGGDGVRLTTSDESPSRSTRGIARQRRCREERHTGCRIERGVVVGATIRVTCLTPHCLRTIVLTCRVGAALIADR